MELQDALLLAPHNTLNVTEAMFLEASQLQEGEDNRFDAEVLSLQILKDDIVSNISHEIRIPLIQIKSAVAMMAEDARRLSSDGENTLADHALAAVAHLENIVANLTHLATSIEVKRQPFYLKNALDAALRQIGRQLISTKMLERINCHIDENLQVIGDPSGIAQVLQQLIDNAIKASAAGGPIEVTCNEVDAKAIVAVKDNGIGIPEDQFQRIFEPFRQVDGNSSTRHFGGAGLGLSIVKLILDKMDSRIQVSSSVGVGSTFSFELPLFKEENEPPYVSDMSS